jgi:hypothetical protein
MEQAIINRFVADIDALEGRIQDAILRDLSWAHAHFWATVIMCFLAGLVVGIVLGPL